MKARQASTQLCTIEQALLDSQPRDSNELVKFFMSQLQMERLHGTTSY